MSTTEIIELSPGEIRLEVPDAAPEPWRQNLNVAVICKDCQEVPPNIVEEFSSGDLVCGSCGLVLQHNIIDTRSEWRSFANDDQGNDDPSRVGQAHNPLLEVGAQLTSGIQFDQKSSLARDLSRAQNKIQEDKGSKQLMEALTQIQNYCSIESWPKNVGDTAKQIYKATWDSKKFRSKNQDAIVAGSIFLACRQESTGRTFKEISKVTRVPKKEIGRVFKQLESFIHDLKKTKKGAQEIGQFKKTDAIDPKTLCGRFGDKLGLPAHIGLMAGECAVLLSSTGLLAGRSPLSVAAVALYAISNFRGYHKDLKAISKAASVSEGTIKSAWKSIYPNREKIIKKEWLETPGASMDNLPSVA